MSPPKYVDLLALAVALAVFLLGGLPLLGFARRGRLAHPAGHPDARAKRAGAELAAGNRQKAMGIVAATTLGRVWLMATAVLLVGLAEREAGLAAAMLVASSSRSPSPPRASRTCSASPRGRGSRERRSGSGRGARERRGVRRAQHQSQGPDRARRLLRRRDPDAADLRQRRQERRVQAAERVQARTVGLDPPRRHRPQHQQGGPLPPPRQRPDDLHDGLDLAADAAEAEPGPDRDRGRLRPDQEHDHRRQPGHQDGGPLVPLPRRPLLLDLVLEHDRVPAAADQHRAHGLRSSASKSPPSRSTPRPPTSRSRWS